MTRTTMLLSALLLATALFTAAAGKPAAPAGFETLLFSDDFERAEADDTKEEVGKGWGTNSKSRAQGQKQVDLKDGAMHITRAAVALAWSTALPNAAQLSVEAPRSGTAP